MFFENVRIVDPYVDKGLTPELKLTLADPAEGYAAEERLGTSLPLGYKEYVTVLGFGAYCNFVRISMPNAVVEGYKDYQAFLDEYWFWEMGEEFLPKTRAVTSIKIGDTIDGDVIIFHPSTPKELFVLPRNDDMSYKIGTDLYEAIDWLCEHRHNPQSGSVGEHHEKRYFVPDNPLASEHGILWPENI